MRPCLGNTIFAIRTDHGSLKWILNISDSTGRLAHWRPRLLDYEFDVFHCVRIMNQTADTLSRPKKIGQDRTQPEDDLLILAIALTKYKNEISIIDVNCKEALSLNAPSPPKDNTPSSEEELIIEQANDDFCRVTATKVCHSDSKFTIDEKGLLIRNSSLKKTKQIVVLLFFF